MSFDDSMKITSFDFIKSMVIKAAHDIIDFDDSCDTAALEFTASDFIGDEKLGCRIFSLIGKYSYTEKAVYFNSWGIVFSEGDSWKSGAFFISLGAYEEGARLTIKNSYRYGRIKNTPHDTLIQIADEDPLDLRADLIHYKEELRRYLSIPTTIRKKLFTPEKRPEYIH